MSKHQTLTQPLMGQFLGWGDERIPHRYVKLATVKGEQLIKVAKSLRPQIQGWQPGNWLIVAIQTRIDRSTGETKIKVKQLLTPPSVEPLGPRSSSGSTSASTIERGSSASDLVAPTKIRVCQGSACRRQGSDKICRSMQMYLDRHNLTDRVAIESVKCLHQCKAAPQAIFTSSIGGNSSKKSYQHITGDRVLAILDRHFSRVLRSSQIGSNLIEQIGTCPQQH